MRRRVLLRDDAKADLDSISDYIAGNSIRSARRFHKAVREDCAALARMPGMGRTH